MSKEQTGIAPAAAGLLETRTHIGMLDGLRGLAALSVVIFHFMEIAIADYANNFIAHAYLAVDFFFCLSGFVIAYAYDNRISKIGTWEFFKLRLVRLHPLVIIGAILGLLTFVFDPFRNLYGVYGFGKTLTLFFTACLMIPLPIVSEGYNNLFHMNPPTWSLFWEYVANIVYALLLFKLRNRILYVLTFIAAGVLFYTSYHYGNLSVGWGGESFPGGAARIFYSFLAGMAVYRYKWIIKSSLGFIPMCLLLLVAFLVPSVNELNKITEPLIVIFYFPFLIALGAGANLTTRFQPLAKFSGDISYPLYMVHYPFIWVFFSYVQEKKPAMSEMVPVIVVGTLLLIGLAYLVMVFLDLPIRNYLKNLLKKQLKAAKA